MSQCRNAVLVMVGIHLILASTAFAVSPSPSSAAVGANSYMDAAYLLPIPASTPTRSTSGIKEAMGMWYTTYRETLSRVRGSVCAYTPSCSHYSQEAIEAYGIVQGIMMTTDRLQRCHCCIDPLSYSRGRTSINGRLVLVDPIEDHQFWHGAETPMQEK